MAGSSVGQLIRERRLALGMSLGQLASSVDRTAASVRGWERGEEFPETALRERLAAVLGVDVADLDSPPVAAAVVAEAEVAESPAQDGAPDGGVVAAVPAAGSGEDETGESGGAAVVTEPEEPSPAEQSAPTVEQPAPVDAASRGIGSPWAVEADGAEAAVQQKAPTAQIPARRPIATARPEGIGKPFLGPDNGSGRQIEIPTSYLADPRERRRYWIRTGMLVVAAIIALYILSWALGDLGDALGEVLDQFDSNTT